MKEGVRGEHYAHDEEVKATVMQSTKFYEVWIHPFIWKWTTAIERNGDYVKK